MTIDFKVFTMGIYGYFMKSKAMFLLFLSSVILCLILFNRASFADMLTLSEGLKLATENSRLIKITEREEAISEADTIIARSPLLPEINASLSQTFQAYRPQAIFGPQIVPVSDKDFLSYSVSIQQLLYDFQGSASLYKASRLILETKKLDTQRIKNLVSLEFSLAYFDLLESEKMILVAEKEVERLESHLYDAQYLYEEGVITKNDLFQAEVRLSDAKQRLIAAKNARAINASRINNILSRPLRTDVQVAEVTGTLSDTLHMDLMKAWESAENTRPEIKITDTTLEAVDKEETAKRSEYFPRFFLKGSYDYMENPFYVHEENWSLIAGMSLNIFSGSSTKAGIDKIQQQRQKLLKQKNRLMDDIRLEVEKYYLDLLSSKEKLDVTCTAIAQAEENLRINRLRYEEGVGTATEVLDAVTLLTIAETNYNKSFYDFKRAEAGLMYATGKDLSEVYQ